MPITTDLDRFRLELGDHPTVDVPEGEYVYLFDDDEANHFIGSHPSSLMLALAAACDSLATRFAKEIDVTEDGQTFKMSQPSPQYMKLAAVFRTRAATETVVGSDVVPGAPIGRVPARRATTWSERY